MSPGSLFAGLLGFLAGVIVSYRLVSLGAKAESAVLRLFGMVRPCPCAPCAHDRRQWRERPPGKKTEEAMTKLHEAARRYHLHLGVRES